MMCRRSLAVATCPSSCEHILTGTLIGRAKGRIRVILRILKSFVTIWSQARHWLGEV
ncbi:hypothetical protein V8C44DRAFT_346267 [Trichoderma aethiopicum]